MPLTQPRYTADETVEKAENIYQRLRATIEDAHRGRYIAIDIETEDYEIGENYHAAAHTLLARNPDAAVGVLRIGYPAVGRIGGRVRAVKSC